MLVSNWANAVPSGERLSEHIERWFEQKGWRPFDFQRAVWQTYLDGASGLVHAATGTGKTLGAWLGPVAEWLAESPSLAGQVTELEARPAGEPVAPKPRRRRHVAAMAQAPSLRVLWITPLRALAGDTEKSLLEPIQALNLPWTVERRTGDTAAHIRARQKDKLPTALITTPESLELLLSWPDARERFATLRCVVVDEWHELLSSKRGTLVELALARLRHCAPGLRTWGLSATLGNLDVAMQTLLGSHSGRLIRGEMPKTIVIDALIPDEIARFPWAGHLGLSMLPQVISAISENRTTLVFTNTRSQTESWYQAMLAAKPEWAGEIALHHGSLDRDQRDFVEAGLKEGRLRAVVCTSSLDLGVDFSPVDRVLQIGSPKGMARLLQRAGRSGHAPGRPSRVTCVPTQALELIEVAAARDAAAHSQIESRVPVDKPLDVLAQHAVTVALGGGFQAQALLAEVKTAYSYRNLTGDEWQWVLDFIVKGGQALNAYPEFKRVTIGDESGPGPSKGHLLRGQNGLFHVTDATIASRHRANIGTIVSAAALSVQFVRGARLGTIEESFVSWLKPGECFIFGGRCLEFVRLEDSIVLVKPAPKKRPAIPRWSGARMPISTELARAIRQKLDEARLGQFVGPEMQAMRPILDLQRHCSRLPALDELLIERVTTTEGHHLFVFPFDGRAVHEGLAALSAYRLSRIKPMSLSFAINDYGFELLSADPLPIALDDMRQPGASAANGEATCVSIRDLFSAKNAAQDLVAALNESELAKRQFREVARISGLIFEGLPYQRKPSRQLQASSNLFWEVFRKYDPGNLLLAQASSEVLERQLENSRLVNALTRFSTGQVAFVDVPKPTPLAFPLMVERMRDTLSSESLADRVRKMQLQFEA